MSAHFPDVETIRSALSLAVRAPSVHNSQPWQWRVGKDSLHLYADPDRHLLHTDPDARDMLLSCGAALNHCVVALAALGWQSKIHRLPNPDEGHRLASIELYRYPASEVDITLAAAIPRRRTDRRHYSPWPVSQGDLALMGARAARAGVTLRRVGELDSLKNLVSQAAMRHARDHDYMAELAIWSGRYGATAGVPARSTPESDPRPQSQAAPSPAQCSPRRPKSIRRRTTRLSLPWALQPTTMFRGCVPAKSQAWCC